MIRQCVVAVYQSVDKAQAAVRDLEAAGLSQQVTLVSRNINTELSPEDKEAMSRGDVSGRAAVEGATVGGLLGFLLATPMLMIPGLGPVLIAGPMAAAMTGAIVGGFLRGMTAWGVHVDRAQEYEQMIQSGRSLVMVSGEPDEVAHGKRILDTTQAQEIHLHATSADARESDVT
jgi:hypothetical protein